MGCSVSTVDYYHAASADHRVSSGTPSLTFSVKANGSIAVQGEHGEYILKYAPVPACWVDGAGQDCAPGTAGGMRALRFRTRARALRCKDA
jgi:hypothetical protein